MPNENLSDAFAVCADPRGGSAALSFMASGKTRSGGREAAGIYLRQPDADANAYPDPAADTYPDPNADPLADAHALPGHLAEGWRGSGKTDGCPHL